MAKRKLSEIELEYVKNHTNLSVDELVEKMPDVSRKEIEILLSTLKTQVVAEAQQIDSADQFIAGNLMAKREGVTIMTPQASELADARRALRVNSDPNFVKNNRDRIHLIKKK